MDFSGLLKRLSPTLNKICYKVARPGLFFNNDDLFQEAVIHLWQDFRAGKLDDKTDSYILQGCYFHLKNHIRSAKVRHNSISLEMIIGNNQDRGNNEYAPSEPEDERWKDYRDSIDTSIIAQTILNNGLTSKEKYILSLCSEGLTTREIGDRIGTSHVMVVKIMKTIRKKCLKYTDQ